MSIAFNLKKTIKEGTCIKYATDFSPYATKYISPAILVLGFLFFFRPFFIFYKSILYVYKLLYSCMARPLFFRDFFSFNIYQGWKGCFF